MTVWTEYPDKENKGILETIVKKIRKTPAKKIRGNYHDGVYNLILNKDTRINLTRTHYGEKF